MTDKEGWYGWMGLSDHTSETNAMDFHIRTLLRQHRTAVPVVVTAVHGGGVGPAPTIDAQVLVDMTDGFGNATDHQVISGIATTRNQGGGNAVINDPKVGDVGFVVVADRDISALKANNGAKSNPGSRRMGNLADSVYIGAMINPANPDQGVQFTTDGIRIFDKNGQSIEMKPGSIAINPGGGDVFLGGNGSDGSYALVETVSGPSVNVKAKIG